jgi:hypothetical protein
LIAKNPLKSNQKSYINDFDFKNPLKIKINTKNQFIIRNKSYMGKGGSASLTASEGSE